MNQGDLEIKVLQLEAKIRALTEELRTCRASNKLSQLETDQLNRKIDGLLELKKRDKTTG
jgi:multidrug resistance efflux pump